MRISLTDLYRIYSEHPVIITDSRKVIPGCLFFALKGENFDGNNFAEQSLQQGAAFAITDNQAKTGEKILVVEDVLTTLQQLASVHRDTLAIPVIGITGTNGKTTTKELANAVLSSHFTTHATSGNFNNHLGVPLTILSAPPATEVLIVEMGANHPGEITFLCSLAKPTHGLITNIGKAHLEGFGGFEGVIKAKNELYQYLFSHQKHAFVNADNELLMELSANLDRTLYGTTPGCSARGSVISSDPFLSVNIQGNSGNADIRTRLVGRYNFENVMAACCVGQSFGVPAEKMVKAVEAYQPGNSRSQAIDTLRNHIIVDSYNANPSSMKAALENFSRLNAGRKMVILGDMFELGTESDAEHQAIVGLVEELGFDQVIFAGKEFMKAATGSSFTCFPDSSDAFRWLKSNPPAGFTILIKGSRGSRMENVLEAL
ncbi:MAG TPA: UDP-N-acetylmuramoyl-tripeptide--D-alanyl-D-alanine ligase [Bacteroidales bacterium]|nr:UDP-N-acetylmuramoyl-tripeptide--D-alanyl-D-alanine ligase [Bacteroidales bacterium]